MTFRLDGAILFQYLETVVHKTTLLSTRRQFLEIGWTHINERCKLQAQTYTFVSCNLSFIFQDFTQDVIP